MSRQVKPASAGFELFPSGRHIASPVAHSSEPRVGLTKDLQTQRMKVDIGNSIDIASYTFSGGVTKISIGIDFFAYAYVIGARGLHFQIDAIDGFFGGNCSFSSRRGGDRFQVRLRILHHSAHLVDGNFDPQTMEWRKPGGPGPFTRDFGEILLAHAYSSDGLKFRYYGGVSFATLARPEVLRKQAFLAGLELASPAILPDLFNRPANLYAAYTWDLMGTPAFRPAHQLEAGLKFGEWEGKGIRIFVSYRKGRHLFAEYITDELAFTGAGFSVDFP
jgi:hypothetical protein